VSDGHFLRCSFWNFQQLKMTRNEFYLD
jgi:hypothetical protein